MREIATMINGCMEHEHKHQKMVYEQYRGYALKIVFRYIYAYDKAVDVVNDGFVKLFSHFSRFEKAVDEADTERKLLGWIKKIMINTAIDELRRNDNSHEQGIIPEEVWDLSDRGQDADQALIYKDLILLIKQLPSNYRTVFNLYIIDGYNHAEIAEMLHTSVANTKSTLSRARAMLKESLKNLQEHKWKN